MGTRVVSGDFEWDDDKARKNLAKHGVSFEEATTVFADDSATGERSFVNGEERLDLIGYSSRNLMLFVVSCERELSDSATRYRIISARNAEKSERAIYEGKRGAP